MTTRITSVDPLQLAMVVALMYALVGLLLGVGLVIVGLYMGPVATMSVPMLNWPSIIVLPIIYAVLGFLAGIIGGFWYKLVARWTGGIELTLTTVSAGTTAAP